MGGCLYYKNELTVTPGRLNPLLKEVFSGVFLEVCFGFGGQWSSLPHGMVGMLANLKFFPNLIGIAGFVPSKQKMENNSFTTYRIIVI